MNGYTLTLPTATTFTATSGGLRATSPSFDISKRAVEVLGGWVGQVVVNGKIVWQSKPKKNRDKATAAAASRIAGRAAELFA